MKRVTATVLVGVLLVACAGVPAPMSDQERLQYYLVYTGEPIERFTQLRIDNWESLGTNRLVLWNGANDAYLLTVWDTCADLRQARTITVLSASSHTISVFDKIQVTRDAQFGPMMTGRDSCPIREIRPIDVRQMKADEAAIRKQKAAKRPR